MRKVLIIGATSAIAEAAARVWVQRGDHVCLVARNEARLSAIAADLKVRGGVGVHVYVMDANHIDQHEAMIEAASLAMNGLDTVLIAHGTLSDQMACQQSVDLTLQEIQTNALSVISLLTHLGNRFEQQGFGSIAVISSVAGDRGRQSNYVYGSAKAMVTTFTSGLRQRLYAKGVSVVTIKPGFVDTPMTAAFKKGLLWAKPEQVATAIVAATERGAGEYYLPRFWWAIMMIIKNIPEILFKRLLL
jgi:decaprenylphospho-beta-D-erythro-pentofuranosid-2-ulose 2-reductase